ncbi:hypothetical protein ACJX0J_033546, partial [Zea mays]
VLLGLVGLHGLPQYYADVYMHSNVCVFNFIHHFYVCRSSKFENSVWLNGSREGIVDLFLKSAEYLDCAVHHVLIHIPPQR